MSAVFEVKPRVRSAPSPSEMRDHAKAWYDRQIKIISSAHGWSWPAHREWIDAYLKEEIRQRLLDLGWRPR